MEENPYVYVVRGQEHGAYLPGLFEVFDTKDEAIAEADYLAMSYMDMCTNGTMVEEDDISPEEGPWFRYIIEETPLCGQTCTYYFAVERMEWRELAKLNGVETREAVLTIEY